ncbi:hypothetical protein L1987_40635 [Smallanthus sonchifolius]|uniref:Uncharacterized protein n=1 Tax=Smallanthus sonchifolius TaxID=185202 RepID=A0ACB9GUM6_9ASTR|nr:hypothetical protein L1987_40635 [Smallanthus sonchifolius]
MVWLILHGSRIGRAFIFVAGDRSGFFKPPSSSTFCTDGGAVEDGDGAGDGKNWLLQGGKGLPQNPLHLLFFSLSDWSRRGFRAVSEKKEILASCFNGDCTDGEASEAV